jgi:hypothetical protein
MLPSSRPLDDADPVAVRDAAEQLAGVDLKAARPALTSVPAMLTAIPRSHRSLDRLKVGDVAAKAGLPAPCGGGEVERPPGSLCGRERSRHLGRTGICGAVPTARRGGRRLRRCRGRCPIPSRPQVTAQLPSRPAMRTSAGNGRFAAATALRRRVDLGCHLGMGGSSCPHLLVTPGRGGPRGEGRATPSRHGLPVASPRTAALPRAPDPLISGAPQDVGAGSLASPAATPSATAPARRGS